MSAASDVPAMQAQRAGTLRHTSPALAAALLAATCAVVQAQPVQLDVLKRACDKGVVSACVAWIKALRSEASVRRPPPPATDCLDAAGVASPGCARAEPADGEAILAAAASSLLQDPRLPTATLVEVGAICIRHRHAETCGLAANVLWRGGRLDQALGALDKACSGGATNPACRNMQSLRQHARGGLHPVAATTMPCGTYRNQIDGLIDTFAFRQGAVVEYGLISPPSHARIEEGVIVFRHDAGGDFVLQPLQDGRLAGIDRHLRFSIFEREQDSRCTS